MLVLCLIFSACLIYYVFMVMRASWFFGLFDGNTDSKNPPTVSVIIPARNEAKGIKTCLEHVLKQEYKGEWEVIVVDDHSEDDTLQIIRKIAAEETRLRSVTLGDTSGKKAALTSGIAAAQYDIILQTDADCIVGQGWLQAMAMAFSEKTEMVSGPVMLTHDGSLFQRLQNLEYLGLVTLGAGSLLSGHPNMANGANIAYRKAVFQAVGGFEGIDQVASGDDELLLQKVLERGADKLTFAKNRDAIVRTPAQPTWKQFKAQRLRWVSKARAYRNRKVNVTQIVSWLAFLGLAFLGILSIFNPIYFPWLLALWVVKVVADAWLMNLADEFFDTSAKKDFTRAEIGLFLLLQLVYVPYVIWVGVVGNWVSKYVWKERVTR